MLTRRSIIGAGAASLLLPRKSLGWIHGSAAGNPVSPFKLNLSFDSSVNSAPAGFKPACLGVANLFQQLIRTNATVTIDVGFGEVDGQGVGGAGESVYFLYNLTYSQLRTAYLAVASGPDMTAAAAQLPAMDPTGGTTFWITQACAKALNLVAGASLDGFVGFSSSANAFDYGGGPAITGWDFCGTFAHEIAEVMGRYLLCDANTGGSPSYNLLDMFRYSASGTRNLGAGNTAGYFSINGGVTNINSFNTGGGDPGDWSGVNGADAFTASVSSNVTQPMSAGDQRVMAACGWQTNGPITWNTGGI
jgi:hypothetical protein